jgi:hypothetical protein
MRLSRPVYESLPYVYMAIGGLAIFVFYLDREGLRGVIAFVIGCGNGGSDAAAATPGLSCAEPRILGRDHGFAVFVERLDSVAAYGNRRGSLC